MSAKTLPDVIGLAVPLAVQLLAKAGWQVKEVRAVPASAGDEERGRVVQVRQAGEESVSLLYVVPPPPAE